MAKGQLGQVLSHLRKLLGAPDNTASSDGELLRRYAMERDQSAFAALVERYAALVYGVCRRVLADEHDAEDAFQATFMILLRKAESLDRSGSVANWLYTVAQRTALKARTRAGRRQSHERQVAVVSETVPDNAESWSELRPVLDEEVNRLPAKYRSPVVLCFLAGKTNVEAAAELGWSRDMVRRRLEQASELLRARLTRRGVTLSVAALATTLTRHVQAMPVPGAWLSSLRQAGAEGFSGSVAALGEGVLRDMTLVKCKIVAAVVLAVSVVAAGAGVLPQRVASAPPQLAADAPADPPAQPAPKAAPQFRLGAPVAFAALSGNGRLVAAADDHTKIVVWDRATGAEVYQLRVDEPPDPDERILNRNRSRIAPPTCFAISPDGRLLAAVAGEDLKSGRTFYIFDLATGKKLHQSIEPSNRVAFTPDGRMLALYGGQLSLWEMATCKKRAALSDQGFGNIAFSGDGRQLAALRTVFDDASKPETRIQLWDVASCKTGALLPVKWGERDGQFGGLSYSVDDKKLAATWWSIEGWSDIVACLDAASGKELYRNQVKDAQRGSTGMAPTAFTRNGVLLAVAADETKISVVNVETGKTVREVMIPRKQVRFMALAVDGETLLTGNEEGQVMLWSVPATE